MDDSARPRLSSPPPSFQRRLTVTLGRALALALAVLVALVLAGAYGWVNHNARHLLESEALNIAAEIVAPPGRLALDATPWDEPHHLYADPRIDPYFVQVFGPDGDHLLRASRNVTDQGPAYPSRLFSRGSGGPSWTALPTFEASGAEYYHVALPLREGAGPVLGYIQVARYEPGVAALIERLALGLVAGYALALASLVGLVWAAGGRVLGPLVEITEAARRLSPQNLGGRVPVPPGGDGETILLAETLNGALDRLDESFQALRRFTDDAAHELQTPLAILIGHIDVALRRDRDPVAYRETLGVLRVETERLVGMVRGLLALARMEGGKSPLGAPVDVARLAAEEAAAARLRIEAKGLRLTVRTGEPAHTEGDPDLLRDVIRNLLDNAVKYTDSGEVRVDVGRSDGCVWVAVEDTGRGMTPEEAPHATARFWRADSVRTLPGSGLGLAIVRSVVEARGGTVRVESAGLGRGSRVEVSLPGSS